LLRRTVSARRALADTEEALGRLAKGRYGRCEQCHHEISAKVLSQAPEERYCLGCAAVPAAAA